MSGPHSAGKGDKPRPVDYDKYSRNWDGIDWRKKPVETEPRTLADNEEAVAVMTGAIHLTDGNRRPHTAAKDVCLHYDTHLTDTENDLNEQMQEDDLRPY